MAYNIEQLEAAIERLNGRALINSESDLLPQPIHRGKVRDTYYLSGDYTGQRNGARLIVASDRISVFDVPLPTGIEGKGVILNQMTIGWLEMPEIQTRLPNHLLYDESWAFPEPFRSDPRLEGRSMIVRNETVLPFECIVRGYITGSAWSEYRRSGTMAGKRLKRGIEESEAFSEPIFTPSTKAETGHDQNISYKELCDLIGVRKARALKKASLDIYSFAEAYAKEKRIIIADTKLEFGMLKGNLPILVDEILTPDSSRFWPLEEYTPGKSQPSFDKQYVRDYTASTGWDKTAPGPELPPEVVAQTQAKYLEAYRRLFS